MGKVKRIKPEDRGLNLLLKVVKKDEDTSSKIKSWDVVAGDSSGVVTLRLSNEEHSAACTQGASIRIQNARVLMIRGFIRVIVDKWGVLAGSDTTLAEEVNLKQDISIVEYEVTS